MFNLKHDCCSMLRIMMQTIDIVDLSDHTTLALVILNQNYQQCTNLWCPKTSFLTTRK